MRGRRPWDGGMRYGEQQNERGQVEEGAQTPPQLTFTTLCTPKHHPQPAGTPHPTNTPARGENTRIPKQMEMEAEPTLDPPQGCSPAAERSHPTWLYGWPYVPAYLRAYGCAPMGAYIYMDGAMHGDRHIWRQMRARRYTRMDGDGSLWRHGYVCLIYAESYACTHG